MPLLDTNMEGRLLWEAKGWSTERVIEEIERQAEKRPELEQLKVSATTLWKWGGRPDPIHPLLAELIEGLAVQPGKEFPTRVVEAGIRTLKGQPQPPMRPGQPQPSPRELAHAIVELFPGDEFALKLADALSKQAELAYTAGKGSFLDTFSRAVAGRFPHFPSMDEWVKRLAAELGGWKRLAVTGVTSGLTVGLVGLIVFVALRSQAAGAPPVVVVATFGGMPTAVDARALIDRSKTLGSKPMDRGLPDGPMPGQALEKDCNPKAGEVAMRGGCWVALKDLKPPCGELAFREGDTCYRPVRADPDKPVTVPE